MSIDLSHKTALVFQGGGVLGIAYVGALQELAKRKFNFKYFVGSSVGSIFALLMAINIDLDTLEKYILDLDVNACIDQVTWFTGLWRLYSKYGWHDTSRLKAKISEMVEKVTSKKNLTFGDIKDLYGNHLAITGFSLEHNTTEFFDPLSTPDKDVVDACVNSCTVPFFFQCDEYLDGGLEDNYPIEYLNRLVGSHHVLGLKFHTIKKPYQRPKSLYEFVKFLAGTVFNRALRTHLCKTDRQNTIPINISSDISFLDFNLNATDKEKLLTDGKISVQNFFK